eukprot:COSAG01_NODE_11347_length_1953_cov_2.493528_4_plen_32_part_01
MLAQLQESFVVKTVVQVKYRAGHFVNGTDPND